MSSSDSSSSDDEQTRQLREALDAEFIDDSLFNSDGKQVPEKPTELKSLRKNISEDDEQYNLFKTTPEFRKYVARHLERILEDNLLQKLIVKSDNLVRKRTPKSRVRLLSNSSVFLKVADKNEDKRFVEHHNKLNKPKHKQMTEENDLKTVAVDASYILSKTEIKSWKTTNRAKYRVDYYKKALNGDFVLQSFK